MISPSVPDPGICDPTFVASSDIYQLRMSRFDLQNPPFRAGYRYEYRILWGTSGTEITTTHPGSLL